MRRAITALLALTSLSLGGAWWIDSSWSQTKVLRVGILSAKISPQWMAPFLRTLREQGWVEGQNVDFDYRDAAGDATRLAEPAAELVRLKVDVLFPVGPPAVRAAFSATRDIPIVAHDFETDPVVAGYAKSYAKPGGNLTGLFLDSPELAGKWLELLKAVVPNLSRVVVLWDPTSGPIHLQAVRSIAPTLGVALQLSEVRTPEELDKLPGAFRGKPQAMIVLPSPMMWFQSARLAQLARQQRLPAISMFVPFAEAGGMLAYGPDNPASAERCAALVAKILAGAKPGDLPIERPTKFEFVVNRKTAEALRLSIPDTVLARADRVIQVICCVRRYAQMGANNGLEGSAREHRSRVPLSLRSSAPPQPER